MSMSAIGVVAAGVLTLAAFVATAPSTVRHEHITLAPPATAAPAPAPVPLATAPVALPVAKAKPKAKAKRRATRHATRRVHYVRLVWHVPHRCTCGW